MLPKEFGVAKPWNFLCQCKQSAVRSRKVAIPDEEIQDPEKMSKGNFEDVND